MERLDAFGDAGLVDAEQFRGLRDGAARSDEGDEGFEELGSEDAGGTGH